MMGKANGNISEESDDSEVGMIGRKFKEMVNTNLNFRASDGGKIKRKRSRIAASAGTDQSSFLYNTLDSIYCVAIIHEIRLQK